MTNEQLATFIHAGGNDELIPLLWENVKKLLYFQSESYYRAHSESCKRRGVEVWDIKQVAYCAFMEAVKAFDPERHYKFVTFITLPFKNEIKKLLDIRNERGQLEPLNNCLSLEAPAAADTDGDIITLLDIIADWNSLHFIDDMERAAVADTVREVVSALPAPLSEIIELYYFDGLTCKEIGKRMNETQSKINELRHKALRKLAMSSILKELYGEQTRHKHYERDFSERIMKPENYFLKYYKGHKKIDPEEQKENFVQWEQDITKL